MKTESSGTSKYISKRASIHPHEFAKGSDVRKRKQPLNCVKKYHEFNHLLGNWQRSSKTFLSLRNYLSLRIFSLA